MDGVLLRALLEEGRQFIRNHLVECCQEALNFQDGTLRAGKIREAAALYARVAPTGTQGLKMALDEVARQAMQRVAKGSK